MAKQIIEVGSVTVEVEGNVNRWQKAGKDRLYLDRGFLDLTSEDDLRDTEFHNPYGWRTSRIVENNEVRGLVHMKGRDSVTVRW